MRKYSDPFHKNTGILRPMKLSTKFILITAGLIIVVMASVAISVAILERQILLENAEKTKAMLIAERNGIARTEKEIDAWILQTEKTANLVIKRAIGSILTSFMIGTIILSIILYYSFEKMVIRPVYGVSKALGYISEGDLSKRVETKTHDELGELANSFNAMAANLQETTVSRDALAREIKEREEVEDELMEAKTLSSLSRTTASIAHEMRTPLAAADMDLEDVSEELEDGEIRDLVLNAQSLVQETSLIIRSMLKVYRGESQSANDVDLNQELRDAVLLFGRKTKGVEIVYNFTDPAIVPTRGNLSRILVNLIGNALDALQHQGKLMLSTNVVENNFHIVVEDNGHGIPSELLSRIFDPEFTTKKAGEGTGLGLWISKRELERIGGGISVESEVNSFTRFTVAIPQNYN